MKTIFTNVILTAVVITVFLIGANFMIIQSENAADNYPQQITLIEDNGSFSNVNQ